MYVQSISNHKLIIQFPNNDVIKICYLVLRLPIINGATIKIRQSKKQIEVPSTLYIKI